MATVGHLAAGFALSRLAASGSRRLDVAVITVAAASPDVDFLLGIDHRGITHSVGAALLVGTAVAVMYRFLQGRDSLRVGTLSAAAVLSHVALDLLTAEAPVLALWPLSDVSYVLATTPLPSIPLDLSLLSAEGALRALGEMIWSAEVIIGASLAARRTH